MLPKNLSVCEKMLEEISVAESFVAGVDYEAFSSDEMMKRAVSMSVINVGELVKNLDDGFRADHPDVPWKAIKMYLDTTKPVHETYVEPYKRTANIVIPNALDDRALAVVAAGLDALR